MSLCRQTAHLAAPYTVSSERPLRAPGASDAMMGRDTLFIAAASGVRRDGRSPKRSLDTREGCGPHVGRTGADAGVHQTVLNGEPANPQAQ